jgi:hypothetical protein
MARVGAGAIEGGHTAEAMPQVWAMGVPERAMPPGNEVASLASIARSGAGSGGFGALEGAKRVELSSTDRETEIMGDKITGVLEVGTNGKGEVVINHPDLQPDENGAGHIVFSPNQARNLARLLNEKAKDADSEGLSHVLGEALRS